MIALQPILLCIEQEIKPEHASISKKRKRKQAKRALHYPNCSGENSIDKVLPKVIEYVFYAWVQAVDKCFDR